MLEDDKTTFQHTRYAWFWDWHCVSCHWHTVFCHLHTVCILSLTYCILSLTYCILSLTHCVYFVADILRVFCYTAWKLHYFVWRQHFWRSVTMVGPNDKRQGADKGLGFMDMSAASWLWTLWSNSSRHWHGNDDDNDCDEDKKANHDHYLFLKQTWHQHALIFFWGGGDTSNLHYYTDTNTWN